MKKLKTALIIVAVLVFSAMIWMIDLDSKARIMVIGRFTSAHFFLLLSLIWFGSVSGLVAIYLGSPKESRSKVKNAAAVVGTIANVLLGFLALMYAFAVTGGMGNAKKISSPDGEHCIVSIESDDLMKYNFYVKDKGVIYRYIFDSCSQSPELEWTDNGILYKDELYEY